ncbi:MAG TPA: phosphoesterase, partial [Mycobacterium sp.]|nr:phosphoesterase [Mycobacterium sp.]
MLSIVGLGPSMTDSSGAPAQTPILWTVLAWARREIDGFLGITDATATPTVATLVESPNLLVNPGAEIADPSLSGYSSVTIPGWTVTGTPTVIPYGALRRFPLGLSFPGPTLPAFLGFAGTSTKPADGGAQYFGGGNVATSTLSQTVDLNGAAAAIDAGAVPYTLSGELGGAFLDPSAASVTVNFLDANKTYLGSGQIGPVTALDRLFQSELVERSTSGTIPVGARSAQVVLTLADKNPTPGNYNNAAADNLSFTVGAAGLAAAPLTPPVSTVRSLDHVFMVYLENKGYNDVVGSPNAP